MGDRLLNRVLLAGSIAMPVLFFAFAGWALLYAPLAPGTALACVAMAALLCLLGLGVAFLCRWLLLRYTRRLDGLLNQLLNGDEAPAFNTGGETLVSRLESKLARLYDIQRHNAAREAGQLAAVETLVADISHQVKTPIANIKMYNEILQSRPATPQQQGEFLAAVASQVDRLDFLTGSMLKISRLETGVLRLSPQKTPLHEILAEAHAALLPAAAQKNQSLTLECDESLLVTCDAKWTGEALFNIMDNAVKYTPGGGSIQITAAPLEVYTRVDITDNGRGIAEAQHAQVFGRFYRESEVQQQPGIGLGLYLAREIVQRQGGYILLRSTPGRGSRFSVYLPL